jgi:hypothetical protein
VQSVRQQVMLAQVEVPVKEHIREQVWELVWHPVFRATGWLVADRLVEQTRGER